MAGGVKRYNIKLTTTFAPSLQAEGSKQKKVQFESLGVVFDEGRQVALKTFTGVSRWRKITEEDLEIILNDCDPIEAPPGEYKIQPEKQG